MTRSRCQGGVRGIRAPDTGSGEKELTYAGKALYILPTMLILTTRGNMLVLATDPSSIFFSADYNQIINGDSWAWHRIYLDNVFENVQHNQ